MFACHVQGAMLMGLSDMGLGANVFDAVYGASAGAINSTYYLSGEQQQQQQLQPAAATLWSVPLLQAV
jgi:predicted acylesterase/phospholipase RssA